MHLVKEECMANTSRSDVTLGRTWVARSVAVGAAVLAAVAGWVILEEVAGLDLRTPAFGESPAGQDITVAAVAVTAAVGSLAAWGLLALLERRTTRSQRNWLALVLTGFLISLMGPLSGTGITAGQRGALVLLHILTAAISIPLLYRSASLRERTDG
jgi:hypothetical protein